MAHAEIRSDHHQESKIMGSDSMAARELSDVTIHVRIKRAALWGAVMLCYLYGDVFGFFRQDTMGDIVSGKAGPIATQAGLLAAAVLMAIPSTMVFLSLVVRAAACRWLNIVLGVAYTAVILLTMPGAWLYYVFLGSVESCLTILIVWHAWTWPRIAALRQAVG